MHGANITEITVNLVLSDLHLIERIKTREDLNVVLNSIRSQLMALVEYSKNKDKK